VRGALFPLNRRSQTSMARYQKKMKRVQPRLEEAKKRFADDPKKLREAQARIMQEEGAFPPLGGCLPIFLQMPVFFGLFSALRVSFDLRQAPFFGWIDDLSRPDQLMYIGLELPILPSFEYLNVLPILMVVLWVLQQMGMPKPADEQAARMQKMMMFMPILFGVMLYNYAAGLSLYMMTTSGLSIIEQKVIKKVWPLDDTEPEPAKRKGCGPFSGALQGLAQKHQEQMKRVQAMQAEQRRQGQKKRK
jgi:YidC/Oxa1 family membrane protein insertase